MGRSWAVLVAFAMATSVLATQVPSAQATFAGTNGRIAFTRDDGLFTANPDGTDIRLVINDAVALSFGAGTPEWSPDGTTILFDSGHASTEGPPGPGFHIDIYAVDAGGGTPRRLTLSGLNLNASWSPTGRSIAFERSDADCTADHISIMNADGTGIRDLTTNPFGDCKTEEDPSFSPDGTQIVFQRHKSTRNREQSALFVMRSDGSRQRQITGWGTEAGQPDWSPDGAWILFNTASDHFSAQRQIFVVHPDGTGLTQLTDGSSSTVSFAATWSPDGRKILFDRLSFANGDFEGSVAVMNADGTGSTTILVGDGLQNPDWGSLPIGP